MDTWEVSWGCARTSCTATSWASDSSAPRSAPLKPSHAAAIAPRSTPSSRGSRDDRARRICAKSKSHGHHDTAASNAQPCTFVNAQSVGLAVNVMMKSACTGAVENNKNLETP